MSEDRKTIEFFKQYLKSPTLAFDNRYEWNMEKVRFLIILIGSLQYITHVLYMDFYKYSFILALPLMYAFLVKVKATTLYMTSRLFQCENHYDDYKEIVLISSASSILMIPVTALFNIDSIVNSSLDIEKDFYYMYGSVFFCGLLFFVSKLYYLYSLVLFLARMEEITIFWSLLIVVTEIFLWTILAFLIHATF